ncbi:MAG: hypothetical protein Q8O34_13450 [Rhodocyclaceae bacterium]|nr:hypothetical protein [Rhodocyclaceae bacterium]
MKKKTVVLLLAAGLLGATLGITAVQADEGREVIQVHPLSVYPGAVRMHSTDRTLLLSKDSLAKARPFYEANKKAGDRITPYQSEGEQGFRLTYHRTIEGKEQSVLEMQATERKSTTNLHPALGELMAQAMMGKRSMAEYKVLEGQYKSLDTAYYRFVDDGDGGSVDDGNQIYRKAYNRAHGKDKARAGDSERSQGRAEAQERKRKMQELKAKGDYAGMVQFAQQHSTSPRQTTAGAAAMDAASNDTWDLWVSCLKDLKAAAYWSKLEYHDGALPPGAQ